MKVYPITPRGYCKGVGCRGRRLSGETVQFPRTGSTYQGFVEAGKRTSGQATLVPRPRVGLRHPPCTARGYGDRTHRQGISPVGILHDPSRGGAFPSDTLERRVGQEFRYEYQCGGRLCELSPEQDRP